MRDGQSGRRRSRPAQGAHDTVISLLLRQVGPPEIGVAGAGEGAGHPRVGVVKVPDGDADAVGDLGHAGGYGVGVVSALLREAGGSGWKRGEADVEFRDGDFDAEVDECLHVGGLSALAGCFADNKVSLQADAVDFDSPCLQRADEVLRGC